MTLAEIKNELNQMKAKVAETNIPLTISINDHSITYWHKTALFGNYFTVDGEYETVTRSLDKVAQLVRFSN